MPMAEGRRILTTHVGSLPRPDDVVEVVMKEDRGEPVDRELYERSSAPPWRTASAARPRSASTW